MISDLFLSDLEAKPEVLAELARHLESADPWASAGINARSHLVLLGMGSSHYANCIAAARLRAQGHEAVAELASSDLLPAARPGTVVIAVSASGRSAETLAAADRYAGHAPIIAMTNIEGSPLTERTATVVPMLARPELGGVACRSFQHTLALLLDLESRLGGGPGAGAAVHGAAAASADLLDRRGRWLPALAEAAIGADGTHLVAPARRFSSAQQGALMLREGPRLPAVACETGDWSHVDVYLTKTTDYRLILFRGSAWEPELLRWVRERGSTMACVGGEAEEARVTVRFWGDDDDAVCLLAEVLVPELLAASVWT